MSGTEKIWWDKIVRWWGMPEQQLMAPQPWYQRVLGSLWLWFCFIVCLDLIFLRIASQLREGWDWFYFWLATLFLSLAAVSLLAAAFRGQADTREMQAKAAFVALRATTADDDEQAPEVAQAPERAADMTTPIPSFKLPSRYYATQLPGNSPVRAIQIFYFVLIGPVLILTDHRHDALFVVGILDSLAGVIGLIRILYLWRSTVISRNTEGLVWRRWRRHPLVPWQDVRSICMVELPDESTPRYTIWYYLYAVATADGIVSWGVNARSRAHAREASEQALAFLMQQTGLPLWNLTSNVQQLVATATAPRSRQAAAERAGRRNRWLQVARTSVHAIPLLVALAIIGVGLYAQIH